MVSEVKPQSSANQNQDNDECRMVGVQAFVFRLSSVFGVAPLRFKRRGDSYTVSSSKYMVIYSYLLVTILSTTALLGIISQLVLGNTPSIVMSTYVAQAMFTCDVILVTIMANLGVYGAPRRMRSVMKFMYTIASVDKSIGALFSRAKERRLWVAVIFILAFYTAVALDDLYYYSINNGRITREWEVVTHYILWYQVIILEIQFYCTAMSVQTCFVAVNDALSLTAKKLSEPNTQNAKSPETFKITPDELQSEKAAVIVNKSGTSKPNLAVSPCDAVYRIATLHGSLCELIQGLNESYSMPLAILLISILLRLIVTPYFTILLLDAARKSNQLHSIALETLWTLFHILKLCILVESGHYTVIEAKKTEKLVCRLLLLSPTSGPLSARLELFSRQLMMQSVSYSPMGLCTLDRPLMASICGAVATYLVVLLQFQSTSVDVTD